MHPSRRTQAICLVLVAALVAAGSGHQRHINEQRRELKIGFHEDISQNLPPKVAFLLTSLGSFRGLAIDYFWIKAVMLKQEGKYYQSLQLAQWICDLSPRFADVWDFQAWEMAYNISVSTETPEERWKWVHDGILLLRDRGIPLNHRSLMLYKSLAWIFFHKMGDRQDDMHWAYKSEWAALMQRVLGKPPRGETTAETLARFRTIADAPETLDALIAEDARVGAYVDALAAADIEVGYPLLDALPDDRALFKLDLQAVGSDPQPEDDARPALPDDGADGAVRDKLVAFTRADILRKEFKLDPAWMMQVMQKFGPLDWRATFSHAIYWSTYGDHMVRQFEELDDITTLNNDRIIQFGLDRVMHEGQLTFERDPERPNRSYFSVGPDVRFIEPLHRLYIELGRKDTGGEGLDSLIEKQSYYFRTGHAGFLEDAVVLLYQYGTPKQIAQAREYYRYLRENFKEPDGSTKERYLKPLEEFVYGDFGEDAERVKVATATIQANLLQSFEALAGGDNARYRGTQGNARKIYNRYMEGKKDDYSARRQLPLFKEMAADALVYFMTMPPSFLSSARSSQALLDSSEMAQEVRVLQARHAVQIKARLWRALTGNNDDPSGQAANLELRQAVYDRILPVIAAESDAAGYDVAKAIPEPPGMDEYRKEHPEARKAMKVEAAPQKQPE